MANNWIVAGNTRDTIRGVAEAWRKQYPSGIEGRHASTQAALDALDKETATAADVDAIIGNAGWARTYCDCCGDYVEAWVRLGEPPDYGSRTVYACRPCLSAALEASR